MHVFISWSGPRSEAVANELREWLPQVIQSVTPFVSSEDIRAGGRWQAEIATALGETSVGIVCVTADNQAEPWLNFEAGALSKVVESSHVIPLAIDLAVSDVKQPLGQFQVQEATEDGIRRVVESINAASDEQLAEGLLNRSFDQWWPHLETRLEAITQATESSELIRRTERELLEEILDTVRGVARSSMSSGTPSRRLSDLIAELSELLPGASMVQMYGTNRISVVYPDTPIVREALTRARRLAGENGYALDLVEQPTSSGD